MSANISDRENASKCSGWNSSSWKPDVVSATGSGRGPQLKDIALSAAYWIIFVIGTTGNLLLLGINLKQRATKQPVTKMFICSLAISDLGMMLTNSWTSAYGFSHETYAFGRFFCKFNNLWKSLTAVTSALSLAVIGVDRYIGIDRPGPSIFTVPTALAIIVSIWAVTIAICMPMFLWFDIVSAGPTLLCTLSVTGVDFSVIALYTLLSRIMVFFLPVAVTLVCYAGIWYKMAFSMTKMAGPTVDSKAAASTQSTRKVARMCSLIVALFVLSWTPFQASVLYFAYGSDKALGTAMMGYLFVPAIANSCVNPIIYGFMWKPTRVAIEKMFKGCFGIFSVKKRVHATSFAVSNEQTTQSIIVQ